MSDVWIVNCDGGCRSNPGPAGFGVAVQQPTGGVLEHLGFIGHATNQIAEITAACEGLKLVPVGAEVLLRSDSQYTLKGITEWRSGWERRGYRNAAGQPVANLEIWKQLWAEADLRRVRVQWVKGHNGDPMNERCDALANKAISAGLQLGGRTGSQSHAKARLACAPSAGTLARIRSLGPA